MKTAIEKFADTEYSIVPYKMKDGTVVTYYAADTSVFAAHPAKCHTNSSLICYKGEWYASTNLNGLKNSLSQSSIAWLNDDKFNNIISEEFEKRVGELGTKWVKVSKTH